MNEFVLTLLTLSNTLFKNWPGSLLKTNKHTHSHSNIADRLNQSKVMNSSNDFRPTIHFASAFSPTNLEQIHYSPTNTTSTNEQIGFLNSPEAVLMPASKETYDHSQTVGTSLSQPSPASDHHRPRRTPKDTRCTYCQVAFTSRGVKLHAQRCARKRESDAINLKESAVHELKERANLDKEVSVLWRLRLISEDQAQQKLSNRWSNRKGSVARTRCMKRWSTNYQKMQKRPEDSSKVPTSVLKSLDKITGSLYKSVSLHNLCTRPVFRIHLSWVVCVCSTPRLLPEVSPRRGTR